MDLGEVVSFKRGERSWRLTVPRDGSLPMGGLIPAFIEWSPGPHPSTTQQDCGVRLERVQLSHPDPAMLIDILEALGVESSGQGCKGQGGIVFRSDHARWPNYAELDGMVPGIQCVSGCVQGLLQNARRQEQRLWHDL